MIQLPEKFLERMKSLLKENFNDFLASYELAPCKAVRVNTLKTDIESFKRISPFALEPVPWEPCGFYVGEEKAGKTVLHAAGAYYVQEPSAMCAAPLLSVKGGERVLDLCSAPGGKGTQLAQKMGGEGIIVLNEINSSRAKILSSNVERLGIKNAVVTCATPAEIASRFEGYFDKVLVDAPCSGEGMFKKEVNAIPEWSVENVERCSARQAEILDCAAQSLKGGGRLVYSTCTFSPEEDELQTADFLKRHPEFALIEQKKLLPHEIRGEGHYAALFGKQGGESGEVRPFKICPPDRKKTSLYRQFEEEYLKVRFGNLHLAADTLYSIPEECPEVKLSILRAGVRLGEFRGDRFEPSHSLAMCLSAEEAECIALDEKTALSYLSGNTFDCNDAKGWAVASYLGFPLGWCKCVNGTAKNHLPKGLRI